MRKHPPPLAEIIRKEFEKNASAEKESYGVANNYVLGYTSKIRNVEFKNIPLKKRTNKGIVVSNDPCGPEIHYVVVG